METKTRRLLEKNIRNENNFMKKILKYLRKTYGARQRIWWRNRHTLSSKSLSELDFKFNTISFNIPGEYFFDSDKLILKLNIMSMFLKSLIIPLNI